MTVAYAGCCGLRGGAIPDAVDASLALLDSDADYLITLKLWILIRVPWCQIFKDIHSLNKLTKDGVFIIQSVLRGVGNEELSAVGIGAFVRHRQCPNFMGMIGELVIKSVAGIVPSRAGGSSTLCHKAGYHTVKGGSIIKPLAGQKDEVVYRYRHIPSEKLQYQITFLRLNDGNVLLTGIDVHRRR